MWHKNPLLFCQKWGDLFFAENFARRIVTRPSLLKFVENSGKMEKKTYRPQILQKSLRWHHSDIFASTLSSRRIEFLLRSNFIRFIHPRLFDSIVIVVLTSKTSRIFCVKVLNLHSLLFEYKDYRIFCAFCTWIFHTFRHRRPCLPYPWVMIELNFLPMFMWLVGVFLRNFEQLEYIPKVLIFKSTKGTFNFEPSANVVRTTSFFQR